LLPAGAIAGWGLHPLESAAFSRRTPKADIGPGQKRHSLGAGRVNRATVTSGVKVCVAPAGLDLDASASRGRKMTVTG
jgi:hypothetical protein